MPQAWKSAGRDTDLKWSVLGLLLQFAGKREFYKGIGSSGQGFSSGDECAAGHTRNPNLGPPTPSGADDGLSLDLKAQVAEHFAHPSGSGRSTPGSTHQAQRTNPPTQDKAA